MRIAALSGGVGGARFLRGLLPVLGPGDEVAVIGNTADDIDVFGLRVCPDLDTLMYTLGGGIDEERGWGRADETWHAMAELTAYGAEPAWFGLGDRDLGTHVVRTQMLRAGQPLSAVTRALCARWDPGVRLLPMSDHRLETHVVVADPDGARRSIHFQEYWVRLRASVPPLEVVVAGAPDATPAPGVLAALAGADVIVLPPSNPVVSIGAILAVPGIAAALREAAAPVVGVSPLIAGAAVRGMADQLLYGLGIERSAAGVALHYGARSAGGILDAWLVDTSDAPAVDRLRRQGIAARAVPLWMRDLPTTSAMACAALRLVDAVPA